METVPAVAAASPPQPPSAPPTLGEQHEEQEDATTTPAPSRESAASGTPLGTAPETTVASPPQDSGAQPTVAMQKQEEVTVSPVLGAIEVLSPAEQAELYACEEVVASGWQSFVQVGLALGRIRDLGLYRTEFESFPAYCRAKWQYGRRYVDQLISAAQVLTLLRAISSHQKPEHETQVRPLVGLTPDQAQRAWEHAVENAGDRRITARMVKSAVNELGLAPRRAPFDTDSSRDPRGIGLLPSPSGRDGGLPGGGTRLRAPGTEAVYSRLSAIKLHLDEDADSHALLNALRHRGLDVTSSREGGLLRCLDEEQLTWANEQRRVIYSYNASDFCQLAGSRATVLWPLCA